LVELLVASAVLLVLTGLLLGITNETARIWQQSSSRTEQFREARNAFEAITRRVGQATLNTYWDYDNPAQPTRYLRQSELRFLTGPAGSLLGNSSATRPTHSIFFQAPLGFVAENPDVAGSERATFGGLENVLNTCGYFLEHGSDLPYRPGFLTAQVAPVRYRFRLLELIEPSNELTLYQYTSGIGSYAAGQLNCVGYGSASPPSGVTGREWFAIPAAKTWPGGAPRNVRVLAANIVALVVLPKLSPQDDPTGTALSPAYQYDSTARRADPLLNPRSQLPPVVQLVMVAIDENSARRLQSAQSPKSAVPDLGLTGLFSDPAKLEDAGSTAGDLTLLQQRLVARRVSFRVFSSNIQIKGARWSTAQTD